MKTQKSIRYEVREHTASGMKFYPETSRLAAVATLIAALEEPGRLASVTLAKIEETTFELEPSDLQ